VTSGDRPIDFKHSLSSTQKQQSENLIENSHSTPKQQNESCWKG
jgi:hypothetical protein